MKTTSKHFRDFRTEVVRYMKMLNLADWKVYFSLKKLNSIADVYFNPESCCVTFCLCDEYNKDENFDPVISARHEVYHLFHARLIDLGCQRFVRKQELIECAERMARVLTEYELVPCSKS